MKNITIEQLNQIISTMDLEKIRNGIESFGYRCASKHGKLEFDLMKILDQERATATDDYEDVFEDCRYFAEVFENVKDYEPYTFIVVTQLAIYRNRNNMEFPSYVDIYTDAPINEEYEKSMEEVKKCQRCGKKFKTYALCEMNGKRYCTPCFQEVFSKKIDWAMKKK